MLSERKLRIAKCVARELLVDDSNRRSAGTIVVSK
jgi:hypothetical protein